VRHRRRAHESKSHGALWSIIYIDLMTQIMAFFVIVWSVEHGTRATQTAVIGTGVGAGIGDQTARMVDLPGDVLFASGQTDLATDGKGILDRLFGDPTSGVLSFDQGGLAQRKLVIHGHTDDVGIKDANLQLGYQRAYAVYQEIRRHSKELPDHVVLCTHADNTPALSVPAAPAARAVIDDARAKNRRITIEDLVVATKPDESSNAPAGSGSAPVGSGSAPPVGSGSAPPVGSGSAPPAGSGSAPPAGSGSAPPGGSAQEPR